MSENNIYDGLPFVKNAMLNADGSTSTLDGVPLSGPDKARAKLYKNLPFVKNARLSADGSIAPLPSGGGVGGLSDVTIEGGTNNGTLKITKTKDGEETVIDNIGVTGLRSAAYTESSDYEPSELVGTIEYAPEEPNKFRLNLTVDEYAKIAGGNKYRVIFPNYTELTAAGLDLDDDVKVSVYIGEDLVDANWTFAYIYGPGATDYHKWREFVDGDGGDYRKMSMSFETIDMGISFSRLLSDINKADKSFTVEEIEENTDKFTEGGTDVQSLLQETVNKVNGLITAIVGVLGGEY